MSARPGLVARARGPAERLAGFARHLRLNGIAAGPQDMATALAALGAVRAEVPDEARLALRAVLARDAESWAKFDALFEAYWTGTGRARTRQERRTARPAPARPALWSAHLDAGRAAEPGSTPLPEAPEPGEDTARGGKRRRQASVAEARGRDFAALNDPQEIAEAERAAERLARAIAARAARRRRAARRGRFPDLARTLRRSLATGGEPLRLARRRRVERPVRLVAALDVSGSMEPHARPFLAFLRGLVATAPGAEAVVFHTRLARITPALTGGDPMGAAVRLALVAEGFGGGTRIAHALERLAADRGPARIGRRTVLLILSDGHDTDPPERLEAAVARLARRARRIVWLSPRGAQGEEGPRALAAAAPHLDALLPARCLADLVALETEFARL